jgi:hypothetical protein
MSRIFNGETARELTRSLSGGVCQSFAVAIAVSGSFAVQSAESVSKAFAVAQHLIWSLRTQLHILLHLP